MISLSRTKTVSIPFMGGDVLVEFKVPTAEDVESVFRGNKDIKDTDIFKKFVSNILSADIEGWNEGLKPEDVTAMPGTYSLVNKAALEITQTAFMVEPEKN